MAYLLFAGGRCYPIGGAGDLKGRFDTIELAIATHDQQEFDEGWANILCLDSLRIVREFYRVDWFDPDEPPPPRQTPATEQADDPQLVGDDMMGAGG